MEDPGDPLVLANPAPLSSYKMENTSEGQSKRPYASAQGELHDVRCFSLRWREWLESIMP